jgi:hypothetical protein
MRFKRILYGSLKSQSKKAYYHQHLLLKQRKKNDVF